MRLASIRIHPVKSTRIHRVDSARVGWAGLVGDREWMVVDGDGELVSARQEPRLFRITATNPATGGDADLRLEADGIDPLVLTVPGDGAREVTMFGSKHLTGRPVGPAADDWLRTYLRRDDVSLIWCDDPTRRRLNRGEPGDHAAFQDGYPVTVISTATVEQVNAWIEDEGGAPITVDRFRPNLVVEGAPEAFAEDGWQRIRIGEVELRQAKLVNRCAMTLVDPDDLSRGKDPIRTLSRHRRWDGKTWCAVHFIPASIGEIGAGDPVQVC